jgi:hypothetical protein
MEYEEWLALQEEFYSPDFEDMEKSLNSWHKEKSPGWKSQGIEWKKFLTKQPL